MASSKCSFFPINVTRVGSQLGTLLSHESYEFSIELEIAQVRGQSTRGVTVAPYVVDPAGGNSGRKAARRPFRHTVLVDVEAGTERSGHEWLPVDLRASRGQKEPPKGQRSSTTAEPLKLTPLVRSLADAPCALQCDREAFVVEAREHLGRCRLLGRRTQA